MDRLPLVLSTFCFFLGFGYTMFALGARTYRPSRLNFFVMLAGFAGQSLFLYMRGQEIGRCPLTNLFESLAFLSWAMVLFYLLIGPAYRLSLLGTFTAPLVCVLQTGALVLALVFPGLDARRPVMGPTNAWLELHAAVSVVSFGAFALAGIAGVMLLVQERQLKTHHLRSIFFFLPPLRDLAAANRRLMLAGLGLLTVGIASGFWAGRWNAHALLSVLLWLVYAGIIGAEWVHRVSPRRGAWLSVGAFGVVLLTLWGFHFMAGRPT